MSECELNQTQLALRIEGHRNTVASWIKGEHLAD